MYNSGVLFQMEDIEQIKSLLEKRLSKKRFTHSLNVADEALKLAEKYGESPDRAYFAGLVHDICKEDEPDILKKLLLKCESITNTELSSKSLWHGPAGAVYIQEQLGVTDMGIIDAVRFHTIGRAGMTRLEEIVYLADLISKDRDYKDVEKMRKLAYSDFDKAMLEGVSFSITNVVKKHGYIPVYSLEAYNQYNYIHLVRKKNKEKK